MTEPVLARSLRRGNRRLDPPRRVRIDRVDPRSRPEDDQLKYATDSPTPPQAETTMTRNRSRRTALIEGGLGVLTAAGLRLPRAGHATEAVQAREFTLPPLPYDYSALEPHIDTRTMEIHHDKHHQAYVNNLNQALKSSVEHQGKPIEALLEDLASLPESIRAAVRNNGGGHYNHALFWESMKPKGGGVPKGPLAEALTSDLGGFHAFKDAFTKAATTRFGSGWAWLVQGRDGRLVVTSTANQDNPLMDGSGTPLLGLDVWEHAYYLKYQNRRPEYVAAWWNTVNWDAVERRLRGRGV
jgi:superoxide dismutase, Fe-Mn family